MLFGEPVSTDEMYCQFLRSEIYRFDGRLRDAVLKLVSQPNFRDAEQNIAREFVLRGWRWPLLDKLPPDSRWRNASLQPGDLDELRLINVPEWKNKAIGNVLSRVHFPAGFNIDAEKKISEITQCVTLPDFDKTLILIASAASGPFTIIDGNHRATAMTIAKQKGSFSEMGVPAYVGISPAMAQCIWYTP